MNTKANSKKHLFAAFIGVILLTIVDQLTKIAAQKGLMNGPGVDLIKGVLRLQYLENCGIAWGMFQNKQIFFITTTIIVLIVLIWIYNKIPMDVRYLPMKLCLIFLTAGAIGNLIDRATHAYVIDFIYFSLIDFPIFNVADIYVTCSVAMLILLVLFYYKDEELSFLSKAKTNQAKKTDDNEK